MSRVLPWRVPPRWFFIVYWWLKLKSGHNRYCPPNKRASAHSSLLLLLPPHLLFFERRFLSYLHFSWNSTMAISPTLRLLSASVRATSTIAGSGPIRWGILSAGRISSDYVQAIRVSDGAEVRFYRRMFCDHCAVVSAACSWYSKR